MQLNFEREIDTQCPGQWSPEVAFLESLNSNDSQITQLLGTSVAKQDMTLVTSVYISSFIRCPG